MADEGKRQLLIARQPLGFVPSSNPDSNQSDRNNRYAARKKEKKPKNSINSRLTALEILRQGRALSSMSF